MPLFLDRCIFLPVSAGTADFVVSTAVTGFRTPAQANATNGTIYSYVASSSDNTQWEIGRGTYSTTGPTLARTTVLSSSNGGAKIIFNSPPNVAFDALAEDLASPSNSILSFGADNTGVEDCTDALEAAFDALPSAGGVINFPPGKYFFASPVALTMASGISSVSLIGSGIDATVLYWPTTNGLTLNYAGASSSAHIRDLTFATGVVSTMVGLTLNCATSIVDPAVTALSDITNCAFRGIDGYDQIDAWRIALAIANVSNVNITNCGFFGNVAVEGIGVTLVGLPASATYGVAYNFNGCAFIGLNIGIDYLSYVQGVACINCNFTVVNIGLEVPGSQLGVLSELNLTNCQIESNQFAIVTSTAVIGVNIANCNFSSGASGVVIIQLAPSNDFTITGCYFLGGQAVCVGILVSASADIGTINGNQFRGMSQGINLLSSASNVLVTANRFVACSATIADGGTANVIINNPGYNPLGVSPVSTMGASPFTITAGPSPETHYLNQSATLSATVAKGGQQIQALSTNGFYVVELGPNESYVVTWTTTAPTFVRDTH